MCNWLARWYNPRKSAPIDSIIDTYFAMLNLGLQPRTPELPSTGNTPSAGKRNPKAGPLVH
jgi:hypothetical protein